LESRGLFEKFQKEYWAKLWEKGASNVSDSCDGSVVKKILGVNLDRI